MIIKKLVIRVFTLSLLLAFFTQGCSLFPQSPTSTPTLTPSPLPTDTLVPTEIPVPTDTLVPPTSSLPTETMTPLPVATEAPVVETPTETPQSVSLSRCYGLHGRLEVRIVVAEAAAVGMKPFTIGEIPFYVTTEYAPYRIQGKSKLVYKQKNEEDWGTYKGDVNLMGSVTGQCVAGENDVELRLNISMSGSQVVVVRSKGYNKQFPWSGGVNIPLTFGLMEGYTMSDEGYVFVLHKGVE
ncbi:MAG: hypothetical protein JW908_12590 [Anaerolineales bacterium]|nr:hypothetical protein [Anaerolineales bacterium]